MTIFEKIVTGEIPAYKIYEDDKFFAFLDINPKGLGHTLLIPKHPYPFVWNLPDQEYQQIMQTAKKLALHLKNKMNTEYVRLDIVGTDVPHAHIHLIPFNIENQMIEKPSLELSEKDFQALVEKLKIDEL